MEVISTVGRGISIIPVVYTHYAVLSGYIKVHMQVWWIRHTSLIELRIQTYRLVEEGGLKHTERARERYGDMEISILSMKIIVIVHCWVLCCQKFVCPLQRRWVNNMLKLWKVILWYCEDNNLTSEYQFCQHEQYYKLLTSVAVNR